MKKEVTSVPVDCGNLKIVFAIGELSGLSPHNTMPCKVARSVLEIKFRVWKKKFDSKVARTPKVKPCTNRL